MKEKKEKKEKKEQRSPRGSREREEKSSDDEFQQKIMSNVKDLNVGGSLKDAPKFSRGDMIELKEWTVENTRVTTLNEKLTELKLAKSQRSKVEKVDIIFSTVQ